MTQQSPDVLICGAGIAGVATAYHLALQYGVRKVVLVDERPPLTLTSDKSTECYRNWWPGPDAAMIQLMNRSIDLLEAMAAASGNVFRLNRRGYLFATADPQRVQAYRLAGERAAASGAGPLRLHPGDIPYQPAPPEGYTDQPTGADLLIERNLIFEHFPYLSPHTRGVLHVRRAGWLSAQQLGMYLLEKAQKAGVRLWRDRVEAVDVRGGRVRAVHLSGAGMVATGGFVNAAGPFLKPVGAMLGVDLPVYTERHLKLAFRDHLGAAPREAPLLIWGDPQYLNWTADERRVLAQSQETRWLLEKFPSGVHARPEGGPDSQIALVLWEYNSRAVDPVLPVPVDPLYAEVVLRGLSTMLPRVEGYLERLPQPTLDGGYYTKTRENRPLVCPLAVAGAWVVGALSGFGIMSAPALGELAAAHITGSTLPEYAPAFSLARYEDPAYVAAFEVQGEGWQL